MIRNLAVAAIASVLAMPVQAETYGVLMKTLSNPFWGAMELGVREGAEAASVDYYLQAVESDQAAEPQLNVCNTMLERKPDAMITAAINSTILLPCLKRANDMEIPVVDLDGNLDHKIAEEAGVDIAFSIGSDNVAAGAQGAEWLAGQLGGDATGPVLVIEGLSGNVTGQKRASGFAEKLAELAPGLEVVASLPGQVTVIGVDGNSDAVKSIKSGRLNASVAQLPYLVGKQAVEMVKDLKDGKVPAEDWIYVPTMVLTKKVLDEGTEPMLEYVK